jgi:1,4-alpha-glucan branching enzyme
MYENFGAVVDHTKKTVQFKTFIPDHAIDQNQYYQEFCIRDGTGNIICTNRGGDPGIASIQIIGDFQKMLPGGKDWDIASAPAMKPARKFPDPPEAPKGWLYESDVLQLQDGFFQYQLAVTYNGSVEQRTVCDPCTKYHDYTDGQDRAGFVIGGIPPIQVAALANRLPLKDLIIYELHLEDFTWEFRGNEAPLQAMQEKIRYLKELGVNAVEILPWTGSPGGGYSWGYMPFLYFSVTNRYTDDKKYPLEKLSQLKALINALHKEGIHVIMDGVYNHIAEEFPYKQIYRDKDLSPFIGNFGEWAFGNNQDLDYNNRCTQEFILDVCKYWLDIFKVDGIRFDYVKGFCDPGDTQHGLSKLITDLRNYIAQDPARKNTALILELLSGYECIDTMNKVNADGCWLDTAFWTYFDSLRQKRINKEIMRALNSSKDFGPGKVPVTYLQNHDHRTLVNQIGYDHNNRPSWWLTQPYLLSLFTTPGAILLYSGQEWGEDAWMPEGSEEGASGTSRVIHRAIHWSSAGDQHGKRIGDLYRPLIKLRKTHPSLRSPNFYPDDYSTAFNNQGYGFNEEKQVVIFHRWDDTERIMVVINFSQGDQTVNIPFPSNGTWIDILNGGGRSVSDYWLYGQTVNSNWGNIYWQKV